MVSVCFSCRNFSQSGNIRVTRRYKTANVSQNMVQMFAIADFKPFQQKTIDAFDSFMVS